MSRPDVVLDNYEAVYDYYDTREPNPRVARFVHFVFGKVCKTDFVFDPGAEEEIQELLEDGVSLFLASKHVNDFDQYHKAALPAKRKALRGLIGKTVEVATDRLFGDNPNAPIGPRPVAEAQRYFIDSMGAIPAFVTKYQVPHGETMTPEQKATQKKAHGRLTETVAHAQDYGMHVLIYNEGERTAELEGVDTKVVQPIKHGIVEMYFATAPETRTAIVPIGLAYSENAKGFWRKRDATMYIGRALTQRFVDGDALVDTLQDALQTATTNAHYRRFHRQFA